MVGIYSPYWEYVTPTGMTEPTQKVTYTHDGLDFTIWVWKQYGEVTDGAETATIKARNTASGIYPQNLVTEGTARRTAEAIFPLGTLWKRRVMWSNNTEDTGNLLMFLAKTGYLNTYYTDAPASRAFYVDGTNNWANPSANIYTLGNIRVRVVKGTAGLVGTRITVTPDGDNKVQVMIYNRSAFDSYTLNEMGNTTTTVADEISQVASYYKEVHMRVVDSDMGIDRYMAINPVDSEPKGLLVKLYRNGTDHTVFFGVTGADFNQQFLVERICYKGTRSSDIASNRKYKYTTKADYTSPRFRSQTYNNYPVIYGTSWSFWTISRVLQPITFKYYKDPDEILMLYFPQTNADFAEDDAGKVDTVTTKAVWVLSHYKLISGFKYTNNVFFNITGKSGNSIDGGWRHSIYSIGGLGDVKYKNAGAWTHVANINNVNWTYQAGEATWGISPESSIRYFTMMRHWSGWAEAKSDLVPYAGNATSVYASLMKNVSDPDDRAIGTVSKHGMCIVFQDSGAIPSDGEGNTLINDYTHPIGVAFEDGLVDLNAGVPDTNLDWDVGYDASGDPQIFGPVPTVTTQNADNITSTTATGHGTITATNGTCDQRGCEWGLVSGGPYPNECVESGSFGVGPFTCNLTDLPCDTTIYYRAKAHNEVGWGYGSEKSFSTNCCPVNCVNYGIRIEWTDNANNETAYYVERNDGGWHVIATLPANTTEYLDVNVECEIAYLYRVRAGNAIGYSNYITLSSPVMCCLLLPSNFEVECISSTEIRLTWQDESPNATIYYIERDAGDGWQLIATVPFGTEEYIDDVECGVGYLYRIRCHDEVSEAYSVYVEFGEMLLCPCPIPPPPPPTEGAPVHEFWREHRLFKLLGDLRFKAGTFLVGAKAPVKYLDFEQLLQASSGKNIVAFNVNETLMTVECDMAYLDIEESLTIKMPIAIEEEDCLVMIEMPIGYTLKQREERLKRLKLQESIETELYEREKLKLGRELEIIRKELRERKIKLETVEETRRELNKPRPKLISETEKIEMKLKCELAEIAKKLKTEIEELKSTEKLKRGTFIKLQEKER